MPKGSKGEKRPGDVIGAAVMVGKIATGEIIDKAPAPARVNGGKKGGPTRAEKLTTHSEKERPERGSHNNPKRRRVTPREYRAAFAARVRQARTVARYPTDEMALLLGVTRDT